MLAKELLPLLLKLVYALYTCFMLVDWTLKPQNIKYQTNNIQPFRMFYVCQTLDWKFFEDNEQHNQQKP